MNFCFTIDNEEKYCDIDLDKTYTVALNSYLVNRDFKNKTRQIGTQDHVCLKSYIEQRKTISPKIEGRILIKNGSNLHSINNVILIILFVISV